MQKKESLWDKDVELDAKAESTISTYEAEARELLEWAANKGYPPALSLLASTSCYGLEEDRKLELMRRAAFPESGEFKPDLDAIKFLAYRPYKISNFDEKELCLLDLCTRRRLAFQAELELANLYEEAGDSSKAEHGLRDHIGHWGSSSSGQIEIRLARLIRSQSSGSGTRNSEVLELLESFASVDAEAAMMTGLMRLRGEGCEANLDLAKKHFDQCKAIQKRTGHTRKTASAADYVDVALAMGWGGENSLYDSTEALLSLAYNCEFKGANVLGPLGCEISRTTNNRLKQQGVKYALQFDALQFSSDDARALRKGNVAFNAIEELKSEV